MKTPQSNEKLLLNKFLKGSISREEIEEISTNLDTTESIDLLHELIIEDSQEEWSQLIKESPVVDDEMENYINEFNYLSKNHEGFEFKSVIFFRYFKYAAIIVGLLISIYFVTNRFLNSNSDENKLSYVVKQTARGQILSIKLSDSTIVYLNADSKLKFPSRFNSKNRNVYLEGEAFFEVKHMNNKPFIVHTEKLTVQVLGTSFNFKTYKNDNEISVTVASGLVSVKKVNNDVNESRFIKTGEKLVLDRKSDKISQNDVNPKEVNAWIDGSMNFDNETLESIATKLERRYNVTFIFENNNLRQIKFSLKQKNENILTILKALSTSGNFNYEIKGTTIILK